MAKALFIEFHNVSPHIETSFELAKRHLDEGDQVEFVFLGHSMPFREFLDHTKVEALLFRPWMPERQGARLISHPNFKFQGNVKLPGLTAAVPDPQNQEELKQITYKGADIGMGVASSLISQTRNSHFDPQADRRAVRDALAGCMQAYDYSLELIQRVRPDVVYIFNGRLCHPRAALRAAESLGVRTRIHDRGADITKFAVRDFTPHNRELIQEEVKTAWESAPSAAAALEASDRWFHERRGGKPRDWFSFTSDQRRNELPDLAPGKRVVTYFSSSDDEFAAIGDDYRWQGWENQLDAVGRLIEAMEGRSDSQLVVRIHPHLVQKHPEELRRWLAIGDAHPEVILVAPASKVDSYALLEASDVVVTGGSTIGLEAVYWGKPSILLGPSEYDSLGAVHVAYSMDTLNQLLDQPALSVDREAALLYGYYRSIFGDRFKFFEPMGFTEGEFMGVDLHRLPPLLDAVHRFRVLVWSQASREKARRWLRSVLPLVARDRTYT